MASHRNPLQRWPPARGRLACWRSSSKYRLNMRLRLAPHRRPEAHLAAWCVWMALLLGSLVPSSAFSADEKPAATPAPPAGMLLRLGTTDPDDDDGHQGTIYDLLFSPDGKLLASRGADQTIRLWSIPDGKELHRLPGDRLFAFSPDGQLILIGEPTLNNPSTQLWNTKTGERIWDYPGLWDQAAFSRDGSQIRFVYRGMIRNLELNPKRLLGQPRLAPPAAKALSRDGTLLACTSSLNSNQLRLTDASSGQIIRELSGNSDVPMQVVFSADGLTIAAAGKDQQIHVWEVATAKTMGRLAGHTQPVQRLDFSSDGRMLASAGRDGAAILWEIVSGNVLAKLDAAAQGGEKVIATAVAFSPTGRYLATASTDHTIVLWEVSQATLGTPREAPLTPERLATAWEQLTDTDARVARQAMFAFSSNPEMSLPFLKEQLQKELSSPQAAQISRLISELDDQEYMVRERATQTLKQMLGLATDALKRELRSTLSAEVRFRIRLILGSAGQAMPRYSQAEVYRFKRLIQVFENLASPAAKELLLTISTDIPSAELQDEARRALARANERP